eukprot:14300311-Alexandrium_andersonii.AAC.1
MARRKMVTALSSTAPTRAHSPAEGVTAARGLRISRQGPTSAGGRGCSPLSTLTAADEGIAPR